MLADPPEWRRPPPYQPLEEGKARCDKPLRPALTPWEEALREIAPCLQWKPVLGWVERPQHINLLELRARNRLLRRMSRRTPNHHQRIIGLCDSKVVLGACGKGRSSSRRVNWQLRLSLPDLLGGDIDIGEFYISTELMPADGISRGQGVPPVAAASPEVRAFIRGERPLISKADEQAWRDRTWRPRVPRAPRSAGGGADMRGPAGWWWAGIRKNAT